MKIFLAIIYIALLAVFFHWIMSSIKNYVTDVRRRLADIEQELELIRIDNDYMRNRLGMESSRRYIRDRKNDF